MGEQIPEFWVRLDPDLDCQDPAAQGLLDYWTSKKRGDRLPGRKDIDPFELKPHLPNVILIDIEHDPLRLRYRLIGTNVTRAMDRDSTGKYYDEIYSQKLLSDIYRSFEWIFEHRRPLRTHGEAFYPDKNFYAYETLNMPMSSDGEIIDMVLGGLYFHPKSSL